MGLAIAITVGVLFALVGLVAVVTVVVGLPGAWIILGLAAAIELVDGLWLEGDAPVTFGWWVLATCALLAGMGELLELVAGALGARKGGGSTRGTLGALIGGVVGAVLGLGIPVPVVGSLIGAVLGTFVGAIVGEVSGAEPIPVGEAVRPATAATAGRVLGTLAKLPIAAIIWLVLTIAAFWPS